MQLTENGEIEWVQPNKETTDLYRAGIAWHLAQNFDRIMTEETDDARAPAR